MGHEEYGSTRSVQNASDIQWFSNFRVPEQHTGHLLHMQIPGPKLRNFIPSAREEP